MKITILKKRNIVIALAIVMIMTMVATSYKASGFYQVFYGGNTRELPIYSVERDDKKIAISFDCAWGVDYTDKLLAIFKSEDIKCTFFTVQFWAEKYPEYLRKISNLGHEIGTHSATHPYMSKLCKDDIERELKTSVNAIENVINKKVELFRPPYGDYNNQVINTAKELGLYSIQWSVDSLDWKNISATEITNRVIKQVKSGSIVLFHNQGLHTAEALPDIIKILKNNGYSFVPIGELIYKTDYHMGVDGKQIKNS